jgi:hypothetical protein
VIRAELHHRQLGVRHRRTCVYATGAWLLLIDELESPRRHAYVQWSHFPPGTEAGTRRPDGWDARLPSGRALAVRSVADGDTTSEWVSGAGGPRLQGWISRGYRRLEPAPALGVARHARNALFATLYAVDGDTVTLELVGPRTLTLRAGQATAATALRVVVGEQGCTFEPAD